jgi:hypothetical protein
MFNYKNETSPRRLEGTKKKVREYFSYLCDFVVRVNQHTTALASAVRLPVQPVADLPTP